jgi:hypothetical protein
VVDGVAGKLAGERADLDQAAGRGGFRSWRTGHGSQFECRLGFPDVELLVAADGGEDRRRKGVEFVDQPPSVLVHRMAEDAAHDQRPSLTHPDEYAAVLETEARERVGPEIDGPLDQLGLVLVGVVREHFPLAGLGEVDRVQAIDELLLRCGGRRRGLGIGGDDRQRDEER